MQKRKLKPQIGPFGAFLIVVCSLLILVDILTKYFEEKNMWNFTVIKGWIEISSRRNPGCAFSFLDENPEIGQPILITLTMIMLAVLIVIFIFTPERSKLLKTALAVVIAGAVGNLIDRFIFREVRDFIGLNMLFNGNLVYCNFADFCIVIGAALVVIDLLFLDDWAVFPLTKRAKAAQKKRREEEEAEAAQKAAEENQAGQDSSGENDE